MFSSSLRIISGNLPTHLRHVSPLAAPLSSHLLLHLRGGSSDSSLRSVGSTAETKYVTLDSPAPGSRKFIMRHVHLLFVFLAMMAQLASLQSTTAFHYAFPVHSLEEAKKFYGNVLGCKEGRSSEKWQDYSLHGHQIVCHWVGDNYRCVDYYNPVDGDEVPVPHAGLALTVEQFHELAERVRAKGIEFIIEPHLRFKDAPGEQWTMFFKDPSGNNLEFKAMTKMENLFAKYNVVD